MIQITTTITEHVSTEQITEREACTGGLKRVVVDLTMDKMRTYADLKQEFLSQGERSCLDEP